MPRKRIWLYATVLFLVTGAIIVTQVLWLFQSARLEESYLNHRINQALCSAMDVLSKDKSICSSIQTCIVRSAGSFELTLNQQEKIKIDSVIKGELTHYNISAPFQTSFKPYTTKERLSHNQALLYPVANGGIQNVLVNIQIPSHNELVRAQINTTFILSIVMLIVLAIIFISVLRALIREYNIRKETVDLVNTMAHDLKTPISNISLALTMIEKENRHHDSPYVSIIHSETNRLKQRARQILGIATVDELMKEVSEKSILNIHTIIEDVVHSFEPRVKQIDGKIELSLNALSPYSYGNSVQLLTAITNIIDNAISYTTNKPFVEISTQDKDGGICISISDNGVGISNEQQELIFKKGYRANQSHPTSDGFGMGLYLAKSLVEKQKGKLTLASSSEAGSKFTIWIPH